MTIRETVLSFADTAVSKRAQLLRNPIGFLLLAMMAGAYVGMGILLIFSVGQGVDPAFRPIVMGGSFGIALILVVFAGSELFTGHSMYMIHGLLVKRTTVRDLILCWGGSWAGNLVGATGLSLIFVYGGGGIILAGETPTLLHSVAIKKMTGSGLSLFLKGVLCNWLVCLALWSAARTKNDMAKVTIIWFCLYAFIAAGFEHSVANMTVFAVALLSEHPDLITLGGAAHNLFFVSAGNAVSGALIMGGGYWLAAGKPVSDDNCADTVSPPSLKEHPQKWKT